MMHHHLAVSPKNVHWGYFSKVVAPALTVRSGDRATIETLTHHAADDYERMIAGDPGAESVYLWTRERKAVARRGAGRTEAPFERGSGEGLGVHILTGPVAVENAEPGDVLEVRYDSIRLAINGHWDARIRGPITVCGSRGSPTFSDFTLATNKSRNFSYTGASTITREPAMQIWP